MTDATTWLNAHRFGTSYVEGPTRCVWAVETLKAGDVRDDGAIVSTLGTPITRGKIWLNDRQATAAEYYGWRKTAIVHNVDGSPLYVMAKGAEFDGS